jgi:hypothetical protein
MRKKKSHVFKASWFQYLYTMWRLNQTFNYTEKEKTQFRFHTFVLSASNIAQFTLIWHVFQQNDSINLRLSFTIISRR